jgi:U-box domain
MFVQAVPKYNEGEVSYLGYVSSRSPDLMYNKIATVAATTVIGTGIGVGAGSAAGGLGAGPGAGIGFGVGLATGLGIVAAWEITEYITHKATLGAKGAEILAEKFKNDSAIGLECPISYTSMFEEPVTLSTCPTQTFERKELVKVIESSGLCPFTRQPITLHNIREDVSVYGLLIQKCQGITEDGLKAEGYSIEQIKAINLYEKHCKEKLQRFVKNELEFLLKLKLEEKITTDDLIKQIQSLSLAEKGIRAKR